jgi:hypothetical protein
LPCQELRINFLPGATPPPAYLVFIVATGPIYGDISVKENLTTYYKFEPLFACFSSPFLKALQTGALVSLLEFKSVGIFDLLYRVLYELGFS